MNTVKDLLAAKGSTVYTIAPGASVYEALALMANKEVGALVVVSDERLVGVISERDYARKVILRGRFSDGQRGGFHGGRLGRCLLVANLYDGAAVFGPCPCDTTASLVVSRSGVLCDFFWRGHRRIVRQNHRPESMGHRSLSGASIGVSRGRRRRCGRGILVAPGLEKKGRTITHCAITGHLNGEG